MSNLNTQYDILPYEKCLRYGIQSLDNKELLAVVIRTGTKNRNCIEIAEELLKKAGSLGILGIRQMEISDFENIEGIGTVKAVTLACIGELSSRIAKADRGKVLFFNNCDTIADYFMEDLRHLERERFVLMHLNNKCALIHETILSIGTVNQTCVSARDIFIEAVKNKAVYIVIVHNHPSGDPSPSREDTKTTEIIAEAGNLIGIPLIDHIIIGDNRYFSFRKEELL